jgi:type II secretory pathway pseudopilin PulG
MLVMLVILVMGITTAFITSLSSTAVSNRRNHSTAEVLAQAKEALIGYALTYGDTHSGDPHGYLPCPDTDGSAGSNAEGSSETCGSAGANSMGRLPWRTLDLPALFEGSGECMWYVVSGNYKNNPKWGGNMNWDTPAQLHLYGSDGNEIAANEIVALVIAPGAALSTNSDRSGNAAPTCGGNFTAAAYLDNDTTHGINNADGATGSFILPHDHRDANGNITLTVNDQFAVITRQDLWHAIEARIAKEVRQCLDDYAATSNGKYPWPAPVSTGLYVGVADTLFGRIPDTPNTNTATAYTPTDPDEISMIDLLAELQAALNAYSASNTWSTRNTLDNTGGDLKDVADNILDAGTYPANVEAVASPAKTAGRYAERLANGTCKTWSGGSCVAYYTVSDVQQKIDAANTALAALDSSSTPDAGMQTTWPTGCFDTATKPYWSHWKEFVFYQIADGYKPGSSANCTVSGTNTCLSLQSSDQAASGSGTHRAAVIIAGRKLTVNRASTTVSDYLETDNITATGAPTANPFKTYRITDAGYQTNNDRVLCVDGQVNCQ